MSMKDTLFRDRDVFVIREFCPETKKEIMFKVTADDYERLAAGGFPAYLESEAYGSPLYRLQLKLNSSLQVLEKTAIPLTDTSKDVSISMDYTSKVLAELGLSNKEITTYFSMSGRGPIDAGEIMLLIDVSKNEATTIAKTLVDKGLARNIVGAASYWEVLPPYAALIKQQEMFGEEVAKLKETTTTALDDRFKHFEQSTGGIKKLRDFQDFILKTSSDFSNKMDEFKRKKSEITESSQKGVQELRGFKDFIKGLGSDLSKQTAEQDAMLRGNTAYFDQLKDKNNANLDGIKNIINDIRTKRDNVEKELQERFQKLSGTAQSQLTTQFQGLVDQFAQLNDTLTAVNKRVANAVGAMRLGPTTVRIQQVVKKTLEGSFSDIQQSVVGIQQSFIDNFHQNFNQIIRVNLANFSNTIQSLLIDVVEQVEIIQKTNNEIVGTVRETIDQVSGNINDAFKKTSNSFENTIKDSGNKMEAISNQLEGLLGAIIAEFERIFADVIEDFSNTAVESRNRADALSGEIDMALNTIRDVFKGEVVKSLENILSSMESRVLEGKKTIEDFWEREKSEILYSMSEVWFVRSPEAVISAINESLMEAKMRMLIVAPTLDDIDIRPILSAKKTTNIRIATAIDVSNDRHLAILSVLDEKPNVSYRNYKGAVTVWGVNRDFEKCVVAVVSKNNEVAGLGTVLEEDIRLFSPILEDCWIAGKKDVFEGLAPRSVDASQVDISFKPKHKTTYSVPKLQKSEDTVLRSKTEVVKEAAPEKTAPAPAAKAEPSVASAGVSAIFNNPPSDVKAFIGEGVKELEKLARSQSGTSLGDNIEAFRQALFKMMGFNSTLFELARAVRELKKISGKLSDPDKKKYIDQFHMWESKLK
ncbi:MAG: hypothetical protein ACFFCS_14965 [Candidatus Hodarchaeota archaeon]